VLILKLTGARTESPAVLLARVVRVKPAEWGKWTLGGIIGGMLSGDEIAAMKSDPVAVV
jgi:hypothetical protein